MESAVVINDLASYTPNLEEIESSFVHHMGVQDGGGGSAQVNYRAAFARWIGAHNAKVAAKTLRDAADALEAFSEDSSQWRCMGDWGEIQWLHDRADAMEVDSRARRRDSADLDLGDSGWVRE